MDSLPVKVDYCLFSLCGAPLSRWGKGALFLLNVCSQESTNAQRTRIG